MQPDCWKNPQLSVFLLRTRDRDEGLKHGLPGKGAWAMPTT